MEHGHYCYQEQHDLDCSVHKREDEFTDEEKENIKRWDEENRKDGTYVFRYHGRDKIKEVLETIPSNVLDFRK